MKKKTQVEKNINKSARIIIILLFILSACLIFIGIIIYSLLIRKYDSEFCYAFATIYAGISGGLCTLIGVALTILTGIANKKAETINNHIPEFYMPQRYDVDETSFFRFVLEDNDSKKIPNRRYYFQNTDKTGFIIDSIKVRFSDGSFSHCSKIIKQYIDSGKPFCITFYSEKDITKIKIYLTSVCRVSYTFDAEVVEKKVEREG